MNLPSTRGEITLILLFALGTAVAGFFTGQHLTKLEHKAEADAHAATARDAEARAKEAKAALEAATAANAKAVAAVKDKEQAAAGGGKGSDLALAAESNPSIDVRIARTLNRSAGDTLPPVTAQQVEEFKQIIAEQGNMTAAEASEFVANLVKANRYQRDVY